MSKAPSMPWYPDDVIRDTRILSLTARGAWYDFLMFAHSSEKRGELTYSIEEWARLWACDISTAECCIKEIERYNIGDVTKCNSYVTITNRRMKREEKTKEQTRLRVQKHRETQKSNADETAQYMAPSFSSSFSSSKTNKKSFSISKQNENQDQDKTQEPHPLGAGADLEKLGII